MTMAKGQKRSTKEPRKQKTKETKQAGPKYMRPAELVQTAKTTPQASRKPH
jgi:hypothetical protein